MMSSTALVIAGIVFAFVALMHLLRILFKWQITISNKIIPFWVSWIGFGFALCLSYLMFNARLY